jgi:hypothetical protein
MARPPEPPDPFDPSAPAPLWLADRIFPDWARAAIHHAVVLAGAAPSPEVEALLVALYVTAEATQDPQRVRDRRVLDRLQAIRACLPPEIPPLDVMAILVTLDPTVIRVIRSKLTRVPVQLGRRQRELQALQRQVERVNVSARTTTVIREEVATALAKFAQDRQLYEQTLQLLSRLVPPTRKPWLTAEARQVVDRFTQAGLSEGRANNIAATVLQIWHELPEDDLTDDHIRGRLQRRAKRQPSRGGEKTTKI